MTRFECTNCKFDFYMYDETVKFCPKCGQQAIIIPPLEVTFQIWHIEEESDEDAREHRLVCRYDVIDSKDSRKGRKFQKGELRVWYY